MPDQSVSLEPASDSADRAYVEELLASNDLPTADVREGPAAFFVASDGDDRVGVGGLERRGDHALLRSVAVEAAAHGCGYGTGICDALEERARADGVEALYLLTTTAAEFFAARGFDEIARSEAPDAIRRTREFETLCPADATCMEKSL